RPSSDEKVGYAAKGMSQEVFAFVTAGELRRAQGMDFIAVSTLAFFSVEAGSTGRLVRTHGGKPHPKWVAWTSARMDDLIAAAHAAGSRVVLSVSRFAWSPAQTAVARALLDRSESRSRLGGEIVAEIGRRGIDGVNLDFEPIPLGQRAHFTALVREFRSALDRARPGYQLTYDSTGFYSSYDIAALTRPGAADAVYIMGYHYRGTWSRTAGSNAPMGGTA